VPNFSAAEYFDRHCIQKFMRLNACGKQLRRGLRKEARFFDKPLQNSGRNDYGCSEC